MNYSNPISTEQSLQLPSNIKRITFKLIVIGDIYVGKSCMLSRLISNTFTEEHSCSIGVEFKYKTIEYKDNAKVELALWDTCGEERFKALTKQYYRDSQGVLLVFDVTNRKSFDNLKGWLKDIEKSEEEIEVFIFGNKNDLDNRVVSKEEIEQFSKENNIRYYYDISSKKGFDRENIFTDIASGLVEKFTQSMKNIKDYHIDSIVLKAQKNNEVNKCC